jgi:hypothetical protein
LTIRNLQIAAFSLGLALFISGWLKAEDAPPTSGVAASEPQGEAPDIADPPPRKFPLDVAGYLSFRSLNDDAFNKRQFFREYAGSIFLSKKAGRWLFHSEFNINSALEFDTDGIHITPRIPHLSVKLQNAFANYNWRDWLQVQAGYLFVPTYWRTHRYQSTNLTVDEPLIDQNVFPGVFKGVMLHGDKYFEDGGFSYQIYGGVTQEPEVFDPESMNTGVNLARALGGKLVAHVPNRHFLDAFDIGYHRLEQHFTDRDERLDGAELRIEKDRIRFLGEFAHSLATQANGDKYFRQGFYLQPSYRISRRVFAVVQYDRLNADSRIARRSGLARQSVGLTYRPLGSLSLKIEADRYEPRRGVLPAYYGVTVGAVYFFHLP